MLIDSKRVRKRKSPAAKAAGPFFFSLSSPGIGEILGQ
jgi:hypothetical protein